jgi:ketosteroid isomerase-like protein
MTGDAGARNALATTPRGELASDMTTREIIDTYYRLANEGNWSAWCDLFAEEVVMDEQLAGHIEGLGVLRDMMAGMDRAYARFQNVPRHIVVDRDQAAVVSHISAIARKAPDAPIEADVANYFRIEGGKIAYMSNHHDTRPFDPLVRKTSDDVEA